MSGEFIGAPIAQEIHAKDCFNDCDFSEDIIRSVQQLLANPHNIGYHLEDIEALEPIGPPHILFREILFRINESGRRIPIIDVLRVLYHKQETFALFKIMLEHAIRALKSTDEHISINVFPDDICKQGALGYLNQVTEEGEIQKDRLILEITERNTLHIQERVEFLKALKEISDAGYSIAIDDFGAGHNDIIRLQEFIAYDINISYVKLDGHKVQEIVKDYQLYEQGGEDNISAEILYKITMARHMIQTFQNMGAVVIAEFIENPEILRVMRLLGVTHGQGYMFTPPTNLQ